MKNENYGIIRNKTNSKAPSDYEFIKKKWIDSKVNCE